MRYDRRGKAEERGGFSRGSGWLVVASIAPLAKGEGDYYTRSVSQGAEDYYAGRGEVPGRWLGAAAVSLGLAGTVRDGAFKAMLEGVNPATGELLAARSYGSRETRAGWDLTFSAPKGVSLLFALGRADLAETVIAAHDRAVDEAVGYVDRELAWVRRGKGGVTYLRATGTVAAAFRHRCSRCGDPQLHTHVVIANRAQGTDGRWSSLAAGPLLAAKNTVGALYRSQLRWELRGLGLEWTVREDGLSEPAAFDRDVLRHFSKRRVEVEDKAAELGSRSWAGLQAATLQTRREKNHQVDPDSLRGRWREEAAGVGFGPAELGRVVESGRERLTSGVQEQAATVTRDGLPGLLLGAAGLTAGRATFTSRDAVRAVATGLVDGASVAEVEMLTAAVLADDRTVRLDGEGDGGKVVWLRSRGGRGLPTGGHVGLFTTADLLAVEQQLTAAAEAGIGVGAAVADAGHVNAAVDERPWLADEQEMMVRRVCREGDRVSVVAALAGAGKTTSMASAFDAWNRSGIRVTGVALSAQAAAVLHDETGMDTFTLAQLRAAYDMHPDQPLLAPGQVVVVDEAGQVGTRMLAWLLAETTLAGGKLVLVGDTKQLPEIEAGGGFRALVHRLPRSVMQTNRRQNDPAEQARLRELRHGDVGAAIRSYADAGRVHSGPDSDATRRQMAADWATAAFHEPADSPPWLDGQTVMIALTNVDVRDLNGRARLLLADAGLLTGPTMAAGGREYQTGDRVVTRLLDRRLGVTNGGRWTVDGVDVDAGTLRITRNGICVTLPREYVDGGHLHHGYALTAAISQGSTYDRAFILGSDVTYREAGYVAASRARDDTRWYVVASPEQDDPCIERREPLRITGPERGPLEAMVAALTRSRQQTLASETVPGPAPVLLPVAAGEGSLRGLLVERETLARVLAAAPPDNAAVLASAIGREMSAEVALERAAAGWQTIGERLPFGHRKVETAERDLVAAQAQVRAATVAGHVRQSWDERHAPTIVRAAELDRIIAGQTDILARRQAACPSVDMLAVLGPLPAGADDRARWLDLAGRLEQFRVRWGAGPDDELRLDRMADLRELLALTGMPDGQETVRWELDQATHRWTVERGPDVGYSVDDGF